MDHNIISWNCRGLKHNFNEVKLILAQHNPQVVCLQETYLKEDDTTSFKNYTGYHSYALQDSGKATGGVSVLIRNDTLIPHLI